MSSQNLKKRITFITMLLFAALVPVTAYLISTQSQDTRNRAAPETFNVDTYRGLARTGAAMAPDIFNSTTNVEEWADYQFGWFHTWRLWHGYSFENVQPDEMPEMTTIPPNVVFSGMISPGWSWAEPDIAGCTQSVKDELAEYRDGEIIWVGNEPGWGDARDPHAYAQSYKSWYDCIKSVNPNIKVSPGAFNPLHTYGTKISTLWTNKVDPLYPASPRWDGSDPNNILPSDNINFIEYLTLAKESYQALYGVAMPIDSYVIHMYNFKDDPLSSTQTVDQFVQTIEDEIRAFRQWMKDNGEERLSLSIKETGFLMETPVLDPSGDADNWTKLGDRMIGMLDLYNTLEDQAIGNPNDAYRLVQRWNWFVAGNSAPCSYGSLNICGWNNTALVHCPGIDEHIAFDCTDPLTRTTTPLGERYKSYIAGIAATYDNTPPTTPTITYTLTGTKALVSFSAQDNGQINDYEISVGTDEAIADVMLWKSTDTETTFEISDAVGKYVNVKAIDDGYNWSEVGSKLIEESCSIDCSGKECGDDGCGGSCGSCGAGETCTALGVCESSCVIDCTGKECGDDGCGGSCGTCSSGDTCSSSGICESCTPDCTGKTCGESDGCSGYCITCPSGQTCNTATWTCQSTCTPDCSGKECGNNGCGGSCGTCVSGETCNAGGVCEEIPPSPSIADLNGDGLVNMADFHVFVQDYEKYILTGACEQRSDLNGDSAITMADYMLFIEEYP